MIGGKMPKRIAPPADARKVPGLKAWVTEEGRVNGPYWELKQEAGTNRSMCVTVADDHGRQRKRSVAQMVASVYLPPKPPDSHLVHLNGDLSDNRAANLAWAANLTWAEKQRRWARNELERIRDDPDHPHHGTMTGYQAGCRCQRCRNAKRLQKRRVATIHTIREVERICGTTAR
jgi:hypothetical protein